MTQTAEEEDVRALLQVKMVVELDMFRLGGNGIVTLKWKASLSEMAQVLRTVVLIRQPGDRSPRYAQVFLRYSETDEITGQVQKFSFLLGKVLFGNVNVRKDGSSTLTLETVPEFIRIKITELGQLKNRALDMVIRELAEEEEKA